MSGVVAIRTLPAICVHRCSVSQVWLHASSGKSGQSEVPLITQRLTFEWSALVQTSLVRDCACKQRWRRDRLDVPGELALEIEFCQFASQFHPFFALGFAWIFGRSVDFDFGLRLGNGDGLFRLGDIPPRLGFKAC